MHASQVAECIVLLSKIFCGQGTCEAADLSLLTLAGVFAYTLIYEGSIGKSMEAFDYSGQIEGANAVQYVYRVFGGSSWRRIQIVSFILPLSGACHCTHASGTC